MLFTHLSLSTLKRLTYNMLLLLFSGNYSMETLVGVFSCKSIFFSISCLFFFLEAGKSCYIALIFATLFWDFLAGA